MANFIIIPEAYKKCQLDYTGEYINNPINLDLCMGISCCDENNGYGKIYPIIIFKGILTFKWYFSEGYEQTRDRMFSSILSDAKTI